MRIPAALSISLFSLAAAAQPAGDAPMRPADPQAATVAIAAHVVKPKPAPLPSIGDLRVPEGFAVNVFADGLGNARMLTVAEDGAVYLTRRDEGDVVMLRDTDGDGRADSRRVVARRPGMHGVAIGGDAAYFVTVNDVYRAARAADGSLGPPERIVDDLPDGGQHPNRTLALAPNGKIFVSVGSTCNACDETSPESATLVAIEPDGKSRRIFASGLRNTIGFDWHPRTGALWGMDHGIDWLGDNQQPEELNRIEEGAKYGWPYIFGDGGFNPQDTPPGGITHAAWDAASQRPALGYTAHAAPMQMQFYRGSMFPKAYQGDAFVAMRGSWNRATPAGYEVVRIRFDGGKPASIEPFVGGFVSGSAGNWRQHGRLAGLATAADGSLLFTDDENGIIYRVSYAGAGGGAAMAPPAAAKAKPATADKRLVADRLAAKPGIGVDSMAFADGAAIPRTYAAAGEDISPPMRWKAGPTGTRTYAVVMEDPDAPTARPFVHWLMWNIPGDVTSLAEGITPAPRTALPKGAEQGRNDRGSVGYFGPKPPPGNPHRYHFQVFALDRTLDLEPGADRAALEAAMKGHVRAHGRLIGTYRTVTPD